MSIKRSDLLFYGGGAALQRFGTLSRRTTVIGRRGEDVAETFARSGAVGTYIDRGGVLRTAEAAVPRVNHWDTSTGAMVATPCLLLEDTRSNGWTYSEQLDNAAWTKTNATITANDETAPDGTATMDKIVEDASAASGHEVSRATPALTDDTGQAVSCYAKADERTWICVRTRDKAGDYDASWVDLSTGSTGTVDANHTVNVATLGNDIYRVEVAWNCGVGATAPLVQFRLATGNDNLTYDGDGSSGLHVWGIQCEVDVPFCSSYIKTEAATATRNAETLSFPFPSSPREASIYTKFVERQTPPFDGEYAWIIGGSSLNTPFLRLVKSTGDIYRFAHGNSSTVYSNLDLNGNLGDVVELLCSLDSDGSVQLHGALNDGAESSGTASAAETLGSAWYDPTICVGGRGSYDIAFLELEALIVAAGSHSLDDFREILP